MPAWLRHFPFAPGRGPSPPCTPLPRLPPQLLESCCSAALLDEGSKGGRARGVTAANLAAACSLRTRVCSLTSLHTFTSSSRSLFQMLPGLNQAGWRLLPVPPSASPPPLCCCQVCKLACAWEPWWLPPVLASPSAAASQVSSAASGFHRCSAAARSLLRGGVGCCRRCPLPAQAFRCLVAASCAVLRC